MITQNDSFQQLFDSKPNHLGTNDCPSGSDELYCGDCLFEEDTCGWFDTSSGMYRWSRNQGFGSGSLQGPAQDHNTGTVNGVYAIVKNHALV